EGEGLARPGDRPVTRRRHCIQTKERRGTILLPVPRLGEASAAVAEPSPAAGEASPVVGEPSPAVGEASPVIGGRSPVVGGASPVVGGRSPVVGEPSPVIGGASPVIGGRSPVVAEPSPASLVTVAVPVLARLRRSGGIMADLMTELLFEITVTMEPPQVVGPTPNGDRRVRLITGGSFAGPKLQGEVLPGGGDWLLLRPDGARTLDVRLTLRTEEGQLIYVVS